MLHNKLFRLKTDRFLRKKRPVYYALLGLFCLLFLDASAQNPGDNDTTFNANNLGAASGFDFSVLDLIVQSDGKILASGNFTKYNGVNRSGIARLNPDGSLDTSLDPGTGFNEGTGPIILQDDGKILIIGGFTAFNGTSLSNSIIRLNANGSRDTSFQVQGGGFANVNAVALQDDGKILLGGEFGANIARLHRDGRVDTTFNPGTGTNDDVRTIAVQADGKILVGGKFTSFNSMAKIGFVRLNNDGSVDSTFNQGTGFSSSGEVQISDIILQPDGKMLVRGDFSAYNGVSRNGLARLNPNGSLDATFDPGSGFNVNIGDFLLQADGKLLIATANGFANNSILRLNPDGSPDTTFN
ncbi:MAG: delta-60 repeat domain-containing protein, partial [Bacteroidota bacterium]